MDDLAQLPPSVELDYVKWWHCAFNPASIKRTFSPSSNAIYLAPFDISTLHRLNLGSIKFKFDYAAVGLAWSFSFRLGLYKLKRGAGGTAGTLVKVLDFGSVAKSAVGGDPATGTVYNLSAVPAILGVLPADGIYFIAFQWQDTSTLPSRVVFTAYGQTLPSYAGWFYYGDGSNVGSLPATIASFGAATTFMLYWEIT